MAPPRSAKEGSNTKWSDVAPPQTALQRGAFVDVCTNWFAHTPPPPPSSTATRRFERTLLDYDGIVTRASTAYYDQSELDTRQQQMICHFCSEKCVHTILANPFAQQCYVVACTKCLSCPTEHMAQ
jgi:hypothetical protein